MSAFRALRGVPAALVTVAAAALLAACAPGGDSGDESGRNSGGNSGSEPPAAAPAALVPISYADWQARLGGYPPDVVVVDMWATWCVSCLERFPKMVEMHQEFENQGVRFVSMCLDDREDADALEFAREFLTRRNADFEHYLMDENLLTAFEKLDLIGIPAVIVYDRNGTETHRLTGDDPNDQFGDDDVRRAVLSLLNPDSGV